MIKGFMKNLLIGVVFSLFVGIQLMATTAAAADGVVNCWAVICGIADYQSINDLSYTDDDAHDMLNALKRYPEWQGTDHITVLIDSAASMSGIKAAIQDMGGKADDDDVCLFYFSGHGTQKKDTNSDEADGFDEAICACDTYTQRVGKKIDIYNVITDDELATWFDTYLPLNAKVVATLDTCFSGGMAKGVDGLRIKSFMNPNVPKGAKVKRHFGKGLAERLAKRGQVDKKIPTVDITAKDISGTNSVVLMGCEEGSLSYEDDILKNGFFTYYVAKGIDDGYLASSNDNSLSAEEVFSYADPLVNAYAASTGGQQDPQLYDGDVYSELRIALLGPAGTISGNVTDDLSTNPNPIVGATIAAQNNTGSTYETKTNSDGNYSRMIPVGTYTVTASKIGYNSSVASDVVMENGSTVVNFILESSPVVVLHVGDISMWYMTVGRNYYIYTKVPIVDQDNNGVVGAMVYLTMTLPGGGIGSGYGLTGSDGTVTFGYGATKTKGTYTSTVTNVVKEGFVYDQSQNIETSQSLTVL